MKKYEITFIVSENYTEDRAADIAKDVKKLIESKGGKVEKEVFWGKRKLIYKIAKNSFGYYYVFIFDIEPEKANKLNKELNLNEKILRYLIVDFIEGSPFFEGETPETGGKEKIKKPVRARVMEEPVLDASQRDAGEEVEEVKKPVRRTTKKEVVEEVVTEPEEKIEDVEVASSEQLVASEEKPEEKVEEEKAEPEIEVEEPSSSAEATDDKKAEEVKESSFAKATEGKEKVEKEVKETKKEEVKDEEMAERKPERRQMTEEERKEQLEKKLAELLKDEEL